MDFYLESYLDSLLFKYPFHYELLKLSGLSQIESFYLFLPGAISQRLKNPYAVPNCWHFVLVLIFYALHFVICIQLFFAEFPVFCWKIHTSVNNRIIAPGIEQILLLFLP